MSKSNAVRLGSDSLAAARSGAALTVSLRLGHTRVLTAIQGCHSLPSCRFATSKAVIHCPRAASLRHRRLIHHRARSNPFCKSQKIGIRILAVRRRSVRLGSDVPFGTSFTTEPVRIPIAKQKSVIRILAARRRSVRLGSDSRPRLSFTTEPVRIPIAKQKSTHWVLFCFGGKIGIRTLVGVLAQTRFPVVRLRPAQPSFHRVVFYHKILIKSRGIFAFRRKNK